LKLSFLSQEKEKYAEKEKQYEAFKKKMQAEYDAYQVRKQADFREALVHLARTQITYENKKLGAMEELLKSLKSW